MRLRKKDAMYPDIGRTGKCGAAVVWVSQNQNSGILLRPAFRRVKEADYFFQPTDAHFHGGHAFA